MAELEPPKDPYAGGGAQTNIDRQANLLNDIIATEGQYGRQVYEQQAPRAQAMLQQQLSAAPQTTDARKAVYDAFMLDANRAKQQHTDTMQRQAQLNQAFMEQAKGAVPIHQADVQQYSDALRQRYEHEQEMERQRLAAQRAASRSSSSSSSKLASLLENAQAQKDAARIMLEQSGVPREKWSSADLQAAGLAGNVGDIAAIAESLGLRPNGAGGFQAAYGGFGMRAEEIEQLQAEFDALWDEGFSWSEAFNALKKDYGGSKSYSTLFNVMSRANADRWGIPQDQVVKGLGYKR